MRKVAYKNFPHLHLVGVNRFLKIYKTNFIP